MAGRPDANAGILLNDPKLLRTLRSLCPKKNDSDITGITFSTPGGPSVKLTYETRAKITARIRELEAEAADAS